MKYNIEQITLHKHIVFGAEHYNPLGLVRSLGEYRIRPIGIIINNTRRITSKSKYLHECYFVDSIQAGYELLMAKFAHRERKPFVHLVQTDQKRENCFATVYS